VRKSWNTTKNSAGSDQQAACPEEKIHLLREMIRIRRFEERTLRVYQQGKIGGFLHLYIGQESIAVSVASLMEENDHVITAYRDHGIAFAVGMTMNECMAELQGKFTGCSKGKGGSMHYFAPDKNYWGGHGIVAGQTPSASASPTPSNTRTSRVAASACSVREP
jgi:pyruvate dehydrogenase E1 component alpha subunit